MFCRTAGALELDFRPCKKCRPLELPGETPEPVRRLLAEVEEDPTRRLNDDDLRARGHDPVALRRWFKKHHGMTFHAYQRSRRLAWALGELSRGARITEAGFGSGYESLSAFQDAVRQVTGRSAARSRARSSSRSRGWRRPSGRCSSAQRRRGCAYWSSPIGQCWKRSFVAWRNCSTASSSPGRTSTPRASKRSSGSTSLGGYGSSRRRSSPTEATSSAASGTRSGKSPSPRPGATWSRRG